MSLMPPHSLPLPFPSNSLSLLSISSSSFSLETPKHEAMSLTSSPSNFLHSPTRTRASTLTHPLTYSPSFSKLTKPRPKPLKLSCTQTTSLNPPPTSSTPSLSFRSKPPKDTNILVVGSTGYIGRFVVAELCRRGYNVLAVARERSGIRGQNDKSQTLSLLRGASVLFADVTDPAALDRSLSDLNLPVDAVVCCLASRNGGIRDSWNIDYSASKNSLVAGRRHGASHFVLLSAICVQKPLLEFQRAKLKFEGELMEEATKDPTFNYSIVRPTAFFKSLAGQVELVKDGKPYVMFGDGKLCACKPISEEDLARFIADCVVDEDKMNRVLPVGGPGKALTPVEQGEMLFRLLGKEPKFLKVPIGVMDFAIGVLDFLAKAIPGLADAAEFGRIGRYYAAESMLVLDPETGEYSGEKTPSYGKDTLEEFFERVIREGMAGQELGEQTIF